jgi:peptide/nickel transport system substrate-binding protein
MRRNLAAVLILSSMVVAACAPATRPGMDAPSPGEPIQQRTLSLTLRNEPFDLTDSASSRNNITLAMFTSRLVGLDRGEPYAVLSANVPELEGDTWRVFPDGRMETTFRLRPGLTWHDGAPLTADDFVFTQRLNIARFDLGLSVSSIVPAEHRAIEAISAPDTQTLLIHWRTPYAEAYTPALKVVARHILEEPLNSGEAHQVGSHPYWTTEYVGLGPYRLNRWEPGAFLEGAAFEGYIEGRPKIDRIVATWASDPNVAMARLLAGDIDLALDASLQFQQAVILRHEWTQAGKGVLVLTPSENRYLGGQFRPDYVSPGALLDLRVRKASIHAIDRKSVADAMLEGEGIVAETIARPDQPWYNDLDRIVAKYAYDLRRSEELMREAGFAKGGDGFYAGADGRFTFEVLGISEGQEGQETTVLHDAFRRAGFDAQLRLVPSAQMQASDELKSTYPAWRTNYGVSPNRLLGYNIATAENRWGGTNKFGWINAEHDRLFDLWNRTLDRRERDRLQVDIHKLINDELPVLPMYFNFTVIAHAAGLQGPQGSAPETSTYHNIHQWQWTR